jgi:hypothetical protein
MHQASQRGAYLTVQHQPSSKQQHKQHAVCHSSRFYAALHPIKHLCMHICCLLGMHRIALQLIYGACDRDSRQHRAAFISSLYCTATPRNLNARKPAWLPPSMLHMRSLCVTAICDCTSSC